MPQCAHGKDFSRVTERVPPIFRSIEDNGSSAAISMKAGGSFRDAPCDPVAAAQPSITVPPCLDYGVCSYRDCSPELSYIVAGHPLLPSASAAPQGPVHPDGMSCRKTLLRRDLRRSIVSGMGTSSFLSLSFRSFLLSSTSFLSFPRLLSVARFPLGLGLGRPFFFLFGCVAICSLLLAQGCVSSLSLPTSSLPLPPSFWGGGY